MKQIFYIALLVLAAAGTVSAQQRGPGSGQWGHAPRHGTRHEYDRRPFSGPGHYREDPRNNTWETVTVTGSLELIDGNIAVRQDSVIYYAAGLNRLIGFIDGLKEGAPVTLEGTSRKLPEDGERRFLLVSRLEINGKTYDNINPQRDSNYPPPRPDPGHDYPRRR
jgi:hypothetical protein